MRWLTLADCPIFNALCDPRVTLLNTLVRSKLRVLCSDVTEYPAVKFAGPGYLVMGLQKGTLDDTLAPSQSTLY